MSKNNSFLEENIKQLLKKGLAIKNKPDFLFRKKTFQKLRNQSKRRGTAQEFPNTVVGLLSSILFLLLIWLVVNILRNVVQTMSTTPIIIITGIIFLNLVSIPIACFIIVKRRSYA